MKTQVVLFRFSGFGDIINEVRKLLDKLKFIEQFKGLISDVYLPKILTLYKNYDKIK